MNATFIHTNSPCARRDEGAQRNRATAHATRAPGPAYLAALKTLKDGSSSAKKELMEEAAIMFKLQHQNLVGLVGVCTREYPILLMMESATKWHRCCLAELVRLPNVAR